MTKAEIQLKAFDSVLEWSKLLVTIASGTLVLSATFVKDIVAGHVINWWPLWYSWIAFLVSSAFGICVVGALSAQLNRGEVSALDVFKGSIRFTATIQVLAFLAGLGLFGWFAYANLGGVSRALPVLGWT